MTVTLHRSLIVKEIRESIKNFILDNFLFDADSTAITDQVDLKNSGVLDSLGVLRLTAFIEDEFQVQLELEDVEALDMLSLASIEALVTSRAGQGAAEATRN
jgi:acyl carrier protein